MQYLIVSQNQRTATQDSVEADKQTGMCLYYLIMNVVISAARY